MDERTRQSGADLAHIGATPVRFEPDAKPETIGVKRPAHLSGWFGNGEISHRIRDALSKAAVKLAAETIVRTAMAHKGLDPEDKAMLQQFNRSFV